LDFLVDDVIEHPKLSYAEAILRSSQPAHALDSTLGGHGRLMPETGFKGCSDRGAVKGRQHPELPLRTMGDPDLETHLAII
jgi:hypothetical protein